MKKKIHFFPHTISKVDPQNSRLYGGNGAYFIEDQYQKDANFDCKDTIFIVKMLFLIVKILILIVKIQFLIMKMLTIIMMLMLIEYYYLNKVTMNILLNGYCTITNENKSFLQ